MHERPQAALFQALRELGYRIDSPNDRLPALVHGRSSRSRSAGEGPDRKSEIGNQKSESRACRVSIEESSQFASALLLAGRIGKWRIEVTGENAEE
jgi:3-phosphoshikimate 1-carboxyvinyltransferase